MRQRTTRQLLAKGSVVLGCVLMLAGCLDGGGDTSTQASTLAAPTALTVEPRSEALAISWSAVAGATGYRIHWSQQNSVDASSASMDVTAPPYEHTNLTLGTPYYYRVAAMNGGGEGPLSAMASGMPLAASSPSDKGP